MVLVIAALFAGCFAMVDSDDDPSDGVEGAAELACERYRTAADEARTLTAPELRERLQDVHSLARGSGEPALADASEDMLAEFTNGTTDDFLAAVARFGEVCGRLGV